MVTRSRHVSVSMSSAAADVYAYVTDPQNLPQWAHGFAGATVEQVGDHWTTASPMGLVRFAFVPVNELGVMDHWVTLPTGQTVLNAMRVLPDGHGCEVVFTVRQGEGTSDADFEADAAAVAADLDRLRGRFDGPTSS